MRVRWVAAEGVSDTSADALPELRMREDGFVWIDLPLGDERGLTTLAEAFGLHPLAVADCLRRNIIPKVHLYNDHLFAVLHSPEPSTGGQVRLVELDLFAGERWLITTHGPLGEGLPAELAEREVAAVVARMEAGRLRPRAPVQLAHALAAEISRRHENVIHETAGIVALLEQQVLADTSRDPERTLNDLFTTRHRLLTLRTMSGQTREGFARLAAAPHTVPGDAAALAGDLVDRFDRLRGLCDAEKEFLQGVVDLYQARTVTKMNIAMERLALMAAVTLPITALGSIYGMNVIVFGDTQTMHLGLVVGTMLAISSAMLTWARRQGWW